MLSPPSHCGQPRNGDIRACYAVWQDGQFSLKTYSYPLHETIRKIRALSFPAEVEEGLVSILLLSHAQLAWVKSTEVVP